MSVAAALAKGPGSDRPQTVHMLHEPEGQPICDLLFFHGLQLGSYEKAWEHTWQNKQGVLWPTEWLAKLDFPTARIMSISYDSQVIRGGETMDQIAKNLVVEVCYLGKVGQDRPVVLVGHSLGGLVLKKLAMEAHKEAGLVGSAFNPSCKAFCNNLAGTFFYATPHGGAALGDLADIVFGAVGQKGPVLDYLTVFSQQGAELNRDFMLAFPTLCLMALVETKKFKPGWLFPGVKVVKEGAAMQGMHNYIEVDEDHISICKPPSRDTNTYRLLKEYLGNVLKSLQNVQQEAQRARQQVLDQATEKKLKLAELEIKFTKEFTAVVMGMALAAGHHCHLAEPQVHQLIAIEQSHVDFEQEKMKLHQQTNLALMVASGLAGTRG